MGNKALSDEIIISAIISHSTFSAAAESLKINPKTISERMKDGEFRSALIEARSEVLRECCFTVGRRVTEAIEEVSSIMLDPKVNPSIRLQAAQTIISNATKLHSQLRVNEELARKEAEPPLTLRDLDRLVDMEL